MTRTRSTLTTDLLLLAVAAVWGSSYLAAKDVAAVTPVVVALALRYAISAVALVPLVAARRHRPSLPELRSGLVLGCTQAAVLTLETFGVAHTSATNAGLIISLTVVFTPVLSNAWSRTWLPAPFFVAAALAVVGVGLLVSGHGFRTPNWGDALMLAAAAVRAVHVTLIGELTRSRQIDTLTLTAVQTVVGALILGAVALPQLTRHAAELSPGSWARLAYLALICSVFAFLVQTWAVRRTSPSRASLLMGTEPLWAVAIGICIGGERLTALAAAGAALIIIATFAGQRIERRHSKGGVKASKETAAMPTQADEAWPAAMENPPADGSSSLVSAQKN
ncbi:DMT family transporter [Winogradskya consettensis]|uniref:DMT family transporter n=1 Tax=Winogradskya consettensis TaxID=113560 RepID=UPI001BB41807|nr:DMT family transporter [Actinoplanes consettensis]